MAKLDLKKQALDNAVNGSSGFNYDAIYQGFFEKGIPLEEIEPRVNVFTYNSWQALGRQVKKGETGVKVIVFIRKQNKKEAEEGKESYFKKTTTVFHISQTEEK